MACTTWWQNWWWTTIKRKSDGEWNNTNNMVYGDEEQPGRQNGAAQNLFICGSESLQLTKVTYICIQEIISFYRPCWNATVLDKFILLLWWIQNHSWWHFLYVIIAIEVIHIYIEWKSFMYLKLTKWTLDILSLKLYEFYNIENLHIYIN